MSNRKLKLKPARLERVSKSDLDTVLVFFASLLGNLSTTELSIITGLDLDVVFDCLRACNRLQHRHEWRYT